MLNVHLQFRICSQFAYRWLFSGAGEDCNAWDANSGIKMTKL